MSMILAIAALLGTVTLNTEWQDVPDTTKVGEVLNLGNGPTVVTNAAEAVVRTYDATNLTGRIDAKYVKPSGGIPMEDLAPGVYNTIFAKQDTLVSGTNIKTINNQSILGSGNLVIEGGGGGGTTDYNALINKPQIGGTTLAGNKTLSDLGIQPKLADYTTTNAVSNILTNHVTSGYLCTVEEAQAMTNDETIVRGVFSEEYDYWMISVMEANHANGVYWENVKHRPSVYTKAEIDGTSVTNLGAVAAATNAAVAQAMAQADGKFLQLDGGTLSGTLFGTAFVGQSVSVSSFRDPYFNDIKFDATRSGVNYSSFLTPDGSPVMTTNMVGNVVIPAVANSDNLWNQSNAKLTNTIHGVVNAANTAYTAYAQITNVNQSVQSVEVASGASLTILAPSAPVKDWIVYANCADDNTPLVLPSGQYYAADEAYTNALKAGVTALYFTTCGSGLAIGRVELKPISVQ